MVAATRLAAHYGDAAMRAGADESEVHSNRKQAGSATEQGTSYIILTDVLLLGDHTEDSVQRPDTQLSMARNRNAMLGVSRSPGQPHPALFMNSRVEGKVGG